MQKYDINIKYAFNILIFYVSSIDKNQILQNFKIVDFNDAYYTQLAELNKYKIVTNDKDFQKLDSNIDILTTQI